MDQEMMETLTTISSSDRYNEWIYHQFKDYLSGCVLDIGSGIGDIAKQYLEGNVTKVILTDYSEDMVARLKEKFGSSDRYNVLRMDITTDDGLHLLPPGSVDTITCSNVLEHIEDDYAALVRVKSLLKKNGKLLLLVPSLPCIYGTLDSLVGHYRRYTKKSLGAVLLKAGFSIEKQFYMNMFGIVTWFMAGRVLKHKRFDPGACKALDKAVPILRLMEHYGHPPFGQSLIAVCKNC